MNKKPTTIGVLTSGGDAPGMNAAVRAVTRSAIAAGIRVLGIREGYKGLIDRDCFEMNLRSVSNIINRGGTVLKTARSMEFKTEEGMSKAIQNCLNLKIDGIVVIGGDGSFRGARDLSMRGIPCIGIPGTIDNDITCTDYTIGFDTAINTVMDNVDKIRDTSESHSRCSIVEVMGRHAGYIALQSGIACGAMAVLVPEIPYDFERDIIDKMKLAYTAHKAHFIIIKAEGTGEITAHDLAKRIEEVTGVESRATILGYVQRGGTPTVRDRVVASRMGYHAVELLDKGIGNRVVCLKGDDIVDYDILEALKMTREFDKSLYEMANKISI